MKMILIAAVNKKGYIGKDGGLIYSLPTDMKFFRETTLNKTIVMGRKTLESFPGGKPLKNRVNIVITKSTEEKQGVICCSSVESFLEKSFDTDEIYVIGGGSIYNALYKHCETALLTVIEDETEGDTLLPDIMNSPDWEQTEKSDEIRENGYTYTFRKYENRNIKKYE